MIFHEYSWGSQKFFLINSSELLYLLLVTRYPFLRQLDLEHGLKHIPSRIFKFWYAPTEKEVGFLTGTNRSLSILVICILITQFIFIRRFLWNKSKGAIGFRLSYIYELIIYFYYWIIIKWWPTMHVILSILALNKYWVIIYFVRQ